MDWAKHLGRIPAVIGETAQFTHGTGSPATATGMFLRPFEPAVMGMGVNIAAGKPRWESLATEVPSVVRGDQLVVRSITYKVTVVSADPVSGFTLLELEDQS